MIKLIKEQKCTLVGHTQWWKIGLGYKVIVQIHSGLHSINITNNDGNDITTKIATRINTDLEKKYHISGGIDCFFIEIPQQEIENIFEMLDKYSRHDKPS